MCRYRLRQPLHARPRAVACSHLELQSASIARPAALAGARLAMVLRRHPVVLVEGDRSDRGPRQRWPRRRLRGTWPSTRSCPAPPPRVPPHCPQPLGASAQMGHASVSPALLCFALRRVAKMPESFVTGASPASAGPQLGRPVCDRGADCTLSVRSGCTQRRMQAARRLHAGCTQAARRLHAGRPQAAR